jgi:hypothetical protein
MKIAIINDTHCGIRNSSDIFIDNAEEFYEKIFFPYLKENNIKHILHLGDYFDNRKYINFKALNRNRHHFLNVLRSENITMDIICGNHDTFYKNTNDLNSLKELLGHYMNEVNIIHKPTVMEYGSLKMGLIPWINKENEEESMNFIKKAKCTHIGGHFDITGSLMMKGVTCDHGLDPEIFKRYEMVLSGHFHTKSTNNNIYYLGSQFEFYWNDAHDNKYFHILDTETGELEEVRNTITLFHKIYYDDSKNNYLEYDLSQLDNKFVKIQVINKSDQFTFDRFVDLVQSRSILELKIAENFQEFIGENVGDSDISVEDTSDLLNTYIESVDTPLDKERIKKQMNELMIEAQSVEIL